MPQTSIIDVLRTKGLDRKIMKPVLEAHPDWSCFDGYFCLPNPEMFLCGFLLEHKSYGSVPQLFASPLFKRELRLNLNYSDEIGRNEGPIQVKKRSGSEIAREFLDRVSPLISEVKKRDSLSWFTEYVERDELHRNTRVAYDYAIGLILQERYSEARRYLNQVALCEWAQRVVPEEVGAAEEFLSLLKIGGSAAKDKAELSVQENKAAISGVSNS